MNDNWTCHRICMHVICYWVQVNFTMTISQSECLLHLSSIKLANQKLCYILNIWNKSTRSSDTFVLHQNVTNLLSRTLVKRINQILPSCCKMLWFYVNLFLIFDNYIQVISLNICEDKYKNITFCTKVGNANKEKHFATKKKKYLNICMKAKKFQQAMFLHYKFILMHLLH